MDGTIVHRAVEKTGIAPSDICRVRQNLQGFHTPFVVKNVGGYAHCVLIDDVELKHSDKPRFDKRSIFAGLIIWCFALLIAVFLYVYVALHPQSPGERDLGQGVLLFTGFFTAIIVFLGGGMSMILGLMHFLWLSWRFSRRTSAVAGTN